MRQKATLLTTEPRSTFTVGIFGAGNREWRSGEALPTFPPTYFRGVFGIRGLKSSICNPARSRPPEPAWPRTYSVLISLAGLCATIHPGPNAPVKL